jgi:hypothetical protein
MARLLYDRQSTETHLTFAQRHVRLCHQVNGTETLVQSILPTISALESKKNITSTKSIDRDAAHDKLVLTDSLLDDCVRTTFERARQYDRENPGRLVLTQIFPDGKFSGITSAPLDKEADLAEKLLLRIQSLGASHPLGSMVAPLQQAIQNCRAAQQSFINAITAQKSAEAEEEIAQAALRKQYELNFYEASRLFGRTLADRLFPQADKQLNGDENTPPAGPFSNPISQ